MLYLLDFDRTLFDTNAFIRAAVHHCVAPETVPLPRVADFAYPDAREFLARHKGVAQLCVLTTGEEALQRAKVAESGISVLVDRVHIVPELKGAAAAALVAEMSAAPVVFVDDTIAQLLDVARMVPDAHIVRMRRPGSGYTERDETPEGMDEVADFATLDALVAKRYDTHIHAS